MENVFIHLPCYILTTMNLYHLQMKTSDRISVWLKTCGQPSLLSKEDISKMKYQFDKKLVESFRYTVLSVGRLLPHHWQQRFYIGFIFRFFFQRYAYATSFVREVTPIQRVKVHYWERRHIGTLMKTWISVLLESFLDCKYFLEWYSESLIIRFLHTSVVLLSLIAFLQNYASHL